MATRASFADLLEACLPKGVDKAHEAIAGRVRIDRIGLDDFCAMPPRFGDRSREQLLGRSLAAPFTLHEEAGERPHRVGLVREIVRPAELPIGWPRRDRAPCDRLLAEIAENSHRHAVCDACVQGRLADLAVALSGFVGHWAPGHAPAI